MDKKTKIYLTILGILFSIGAIGKIVEHYNSNKEVDESFIKIAKEVVKTDESKNINDFIDNLANIEILDDEDKNITPDFNISILDLDIYNLFNKCLFTNRCQSNIVNKDILDNLEKINKNNNKNDIKKIEEAINISLSEDTSLLTNKEDIRNIQLKILGFLRNNDSGYIILKDNKGNILYNNDTIFNNILSFLEKYKDEDISFDKISSYINKSIIYDNFLDRLLTIVESSINHKNLYDIKDSTLNGIKGYLVINKIENKELTDEDKQIIFKIIDILKIDKKELSL